MKTAKVSAILLVLLFTLAMPAISMAAVIGKITAIQGDVDVLKPGMERAAPAALQQPVSEGDIVRTKSNAKAEITFADDSVIRLAPGSRLQITEYLLEGNKRKSGVMNLFRGKVRAVVSKSRGFLGVAFGAGDRFEVRTPTAVAGVKGTDFFVFYNMGVTGIVVKEGMVDTFNPQMPNQVVPVSAGNATVIAGDKPPSPPRPATDVEVIRHTKDTDTGEKPKDSGGSSAITASVDAFSVEGTFGYEAPKGGIAPLPTETVTTVETVKIPDSESHPELLANIIAPVINADIIAPVITVSGPAQYTNLSTASFTVTFNEPVTVTYKMGTWGTTATGTTSDTFSIAGLAEGPHILTVIAIDAAGNTSTKTYSWTTDYTPPASLTLTGTPASITNVKSATIGATATDATAITYSYTLDGIASTGNLTGLSEGAHTFTATATDAAGNTSTKTYSWTTDYTAPVLGATTPAATPDMSGKELTTITAALSANEASTYSYSLDGGAAVSTGASLTISGLAEGSHILTYTATDAAGNSSLASRAFSLSRYSLSGLSSKILASTGLQAPVTGEVAGVSNQNWGGWNTNMIGAGTNPVTGGIPPSGTVFAGGTSSDTTLSNNGGYWLETINFIAAGTNLVGVLSGTSTLKYLSADRLGLGTGAITGAYNATSTQIADSGAYTETPLVLSGKIVPDNNATFAYAGAGLYSLDTNWFWLDIEGNSTGLMGGTVSPWAGPTSVTYMGKYDVASGNGFGPPYLWTPEINSYNAKNSTNTTYDNGAYKGFIGGRWNADGTINAKAYSLYIDPQGNAGILKGDLNGAYYPTINKFSADGTWTPTALTTGLNATTATFNLVSTSYWYNITSSSSGSSRAYVTNYGANTVSVIDGTTNTVIATIPVGSAPYGVDVNPQTNRAYVTNNVNNTVSVIDTTTNTVVATILVGVNPYGVGVNPQTNRVYVTNYTSNTVSVIDTTTNTVVATIPVAGGPHSIGVNPQTNRAYVANYSPNTVSVIDTTTNTNIATIPVGVVPFDVYGVGVNPPTNRAYVTNTSSNTVSVIDTTTNTVVATIPVGVNPAGVDVNPQTNRAYVANTSSNTVSVIDTTTNTIIATIPVGGSPTGVDVNPQTNRAYVTNRGNNTVSVIDTTTNAIVATIPVGANSYGVDTYTGIYIYPYGRFNGSGSITVHGDEMLTNDTWRYSITGQDWGIWKSIIGGDYAGPASDITCATAGSCDTWSLSTTVKLGQTIYGTQTDGSLWSNNKLAGTTYGYGADITTTPNTWISVGETIGTFDPVNSAWQAVQTGAWLDTNKFLAMTQTAQGQAALTALNIPFAEVGRANLSGTNGNLNVNMNNVIFFAYNTGAAPKIWATGNVNGTYTTNPLAGAAVGLAGNGLNANFAVQNWDAVNNKWLSTVNGSGTYTGTGTLNGSNVQMQGAAAGTITPATTSFSGTAAGVAK